jgi:hypothetical protein
MHRLFLEEHLNAIWRPLKGGPINGRRGRRLVLREISGHPGRGEKQLKSVRDDHRLSLADRAKSLSNLLSHVLSQVGDEDLQSQEQ